MQCTLGTIQDGGRKKNGNILISYTNQVITKGLFYNNKLRIQVEKYYICVF